MKNKTFVIADIHGAYKALLQVFERSKFNYKKDTLICLGDTCDGWKQTRECFDELLKVKNLIYIIGNHDSWTLTWMQNGDWFGDNIWTSQGGENTKLSYGNDFKNVPKSHELLLENALPYYIKDNDVFVHGGINVWKPIENQAPYNLMWDRDLVFGAYKNDYRRIFVGHTTTENFTDKKGNRITTPLKRGKNIWMLDTGAGWSGKLSIMDIKYQHCIQTKKEEVKERWESGLIRLS